MPNRISVVIPCYNDARFLERALRNAWGQTRPPDEVIVVDDGSTDDTAAIAKRHPGVHYIHQANQGSFGARNRGVADSTGSVIAFLDADDLWPVDMLEKSVEVMDRDSSVEIVQGLIQDVEEVEAPPDPSVATLRVISPPYQFVNLGSMLFARSVFARLGAFDTVMTANGDTDWFLRAWENNCRKVLLNQVFLYYLIRPGSVTTSQPPPLSLLPGLLKKHLDRRRANTSQSSALPGLAGYFGGFPDRSQRFPRNEFITVSLPRAGPAVVPRIAIAATDDPAVADHQFRLASVWRQRGRLEQARRSYLKVLELDPGHARARLGLAQALEAMGKAPEAIALLRESLDRLPNEAELHKAFVEAQDRSGGLSAAFDFYRLQQIGAAAGELAADAVICCFVCRNERSRLPYFLRYYREKGVARFLAVDNDSRDGSTAWLLEQPDVDLWQSSLSFNRANFGSAWFELLLRRHGRGRWCVVVDVDELLYYEDCETVGLPEFCRLLAGEQKRALGAVLLEMYSGGTVANTECVPGTDFRAACPWFDRDFFHGRHENAGPHRNQAFLFGGARQRVFGPSDAFCLNKVPLLRYDTDCILAGGQHWTNLPAEQIAAERGCLLHFKFFSDFKRKVGEEVSRKEHYAEALQYRRYEEALQDWEELSLFDPKQSIALRNSRQLIELGIIRGRHGGSTALASRELFVPRIDPVRTSERRPDWSVMITVYDRTEHLERCLRSVLQQAREPADMQIEVVNDAGPPEKSRAIEEIVRRAAGDRVAFFRVAERRGHPFIFNLCIERALGRWVHILHDDDWLAPGFYAAIEDGIRTAPELGAAFCRHVLLDRNGEQKWISDLERKSPGLLDDWLERIGVRCRLAFSSMVVKREAFETLGGFSPSAGSAFDWDMWKRIAVSHPVWFEPRALACCGREGDSLTDQFMLSGKQIADSLRSIALSEEYLPASLARDISARAREHYAGYAIALAEQQLRDRNHQAAFENLRQGLAASCSPSVQRRLVEALTRTKP